MHKPGALERAQPFVPLVIAGIHAHPAEPEVGVALKVLVEG